jgi:hypothetical protein
MPIDDAEREAGSSMGISQRFSREAGAPRYSQIRGFLTRLVATFEEATLMATYKSRIMPKRTNSADRHSAHSGTTQQGAQQPAATENLRETNVEPREENPKTSPENLINTFLRGSMSALSFPKLPGDVKD